MDEIIINGNNHRYLSELDEFRHYLPDGVINKTKPDVGGTYIAANCDCNYIIVCPFKDLVDSIVMDKNNKYEVFKCYGGVNESEFKTYMERTTVHKIAVTYDSFSSKIINWINNYKDWRVLIDEYHLILEDMDYRYDAISNLINNIKIFNHYTFLSATPINVDFEIPELKKLQHYKVVWNNNRTVTVQRIQCSKLNLGLVKFIDDFMQGNCNIDNIPVEQLFIFCNSVKLINQVLETLELNQNDVKICCANRIRNRKILGKYNIESVTAPNKKLNFFTKKGFQGCNMFTNNGLIVIVSDGSKENTLVDISTTLEQIAGRLRENEEYHNIFNSIIIHLFSYVGYNISDNTFNQIMTEKESNSKILISGYNKLNNDEKCIYNQKLNLESEIVSIINNEMVYNQLKKQSFINKQRIRNQYKNDNCMLAAYRDGSGRFSTADEITAEGLEIFKDKIKKMVTISYKQLLKNYLDITNEELLKEYDIEYPEFSLFKKYLKESEMNTLKWNKDKMMKKVSDIKLLDKVFMNIYREGFISSKELKILLKNEFDRLGISITPKASLILDNKLYNVVETSKRIDGKKVKGYELGTKIFNFSI